MKKPSPLSDLPRPPGALPPGRHDEYYRLVRRYLDAGWPVEGVRDKVVREIVAKDGKALAAEDQGRLF